MFVEPLLEGLYDRNMHLEWALEDREITTVGFSSKDEYHISLPLSEKLTGYARSQILFDLHQIGWKWLVMISLESCVRTTSCGLHNHYQYLTRGGRRTFIMCACGKPIACCKAKANPLHAEVHFSIQSLYERSRVHSIKQKLQLDLWVSILEYLSPADILAFMLVFPEVLSQACGVIKWRNLWEGNFHGFQGIMKNVWNQLRMFHLADIPPGSQNRVIPWRPPVKHPLYKKWKQYVKTRASILCPYPWQLSKISLPKRLRHLIIRPDVRRPMQDLWETWQLRDLTFSEGDRMVPEGVSLLDIRVEDPCELPAVIRV